ncbi:acetolactate synthase large subunit [Gammaproteobacteria bacterium]|nr:acetolactate synthase large subunit [Gammaproteobacteria bacterium]
MLASELLVRCLEEEGIEIIFGLPGEENADFMMALEKSEKIRFVLTRHEQGAAFMAEAYGRLTGNPAGCLSTLGPGATNLITGVADANMDRAPMIVLTGQGSTDRLHKESHQIMDTVSMFKPVTKWATSIYNPDTIPEIVRKAVRISRSEKPGAVLIELPEDIARETTSSEPITPRRYRRSVPDEEVIEEASRLIMQSEQPLIIAGNGCIRKRASAELRRLCDFSKIGVVSSFMAKGAVDMDAEYCLFTIGLGARDRIAEVIDSADLIITLGLDMVEYPPKLWNTDSAKPIIHADFLPAEIDENYHPTLELIGDLAKTISAIKDELEEKNFQVTERAVYLSCRQSLLSDFSEYDSDSDRETIRPQQVLSLVRKSLGPKDILLSDVGAHKMWIARHYHCHEPNTCLIPNGFCSMGFALPAAIAASIVEPKRRILGIAGDGGFLMNLQEMETARRLNSNLVMMVWEDKAFGLISWKQEDSFGRHTDLSFGNPDWLELASAFRWQGAHVKNSDELRERLETALETSGPSLLVLPIDYRENQVLTKKLNDLQDCQR